MMSADWELVDLQYPPTWVRKRDDDQVEHRTRIFDFNVHSLTPPGMIENAPEGFDLLAFHRRTVLRQWFERCRN